MKRRCFLAAAFCTSVAMPWATASCSLVMGSSLTTRIVKGCPEATAQKNCTITSPFEALVARPVGNDEVLGVEHVHEARRVALGRDVAATPRIRRCDQHERRRGDERLAMRVQL